MTETRSTTTTRGLRVTVRARYSQEHSNPKKPSYFFLYTITLENLGSEALQLLERHWEITNAQGEVQHVRGPGVVGKQPVLEPGQRFEYTSGCPLSTSSGFMKGEFSILVLGTGERFDADIAVFALRRDEAVLN